MIITLVIIIYLAYNLFFKKSEYTLDSKKRRCPKEIAIDVLTKRSWNSKLGTLAGSRYYRDFWTRDCFFSSLGLLAINENKRVYHNLCTMMKYTRDDGLVPLRVGTYSHIPRFFIGIDLPGIMPIYHDDKHGVEPTDSNLQYIILVNEYIKQTGRTPTKLIEHCKIVYKYTKALADKSKDGLLYGDSFDSWHDSFDTSGPCLFSNILWTQCQKSMMEIFKNERQLYTECKTRYESLLRTITKKYWSGSYLRIYPNMNHACSAGNALAILYNIVDNRTARIIINWYSNKVTNVIPSVYPPLPKNDIHMPMRMIGLEDYHNKHIWPWVHYLFACACKYTEYYPENIHNGSKILEMLMSYDSFERIDPNTLKPVTHFLQSSEFGFSESAGMYLKYQKMPHDFHHGSHDP